MPNRGYLPAQDQALLVWAIHFHTVANSNFAATGLTTAQLTALMALITNFDVALQAHQFARDEAKAKTSDKNLTANAMVEDIRALARIVSSHPGASDALKIELGIKLPPSPMPEQPEPPLDLQAQVDAFGVVHLSWKRGSNHSGTTFWIETRPYDSSEWTFVNSTLGTRFKVTGLEPGTATAYRVVAKRSRFVSVPSNPAFVYSQAPEEEVPLQIAA